MVELTLPWPPVELSPNARLHWAKVAKVKAKYRQQCWAATKEANAKIVADGKLTLVVIFYRPSNRLMDRDNLLARMKSGLDGVCDALGINDNRFDPISISVSNNLGGYVKLAIMKIGMDE
jgi:crossover junction endodeoxyribonuclease RusA